MKILHVINSLNIGGAQALLREALPLFKNKGIDSDVFVLKKSTEGCYEQELAADGIDVIHSHVKNEYSPLQTREIVRAANKNNYDAIHSHTFPSQYWVSAAAPFLKNKSVRLFTTEHNTTNRRRGKKIFRTLDRLVYKQYNRIICCSDETRTALTKWLPTTDSKSLVIANGVNVEKFRSAAPYKKHELIADCSEKDIFIVMVARLTGQKDHATVIKAASRLPDRCHVLFVGGGEKEKEYRQAVEELHLAERVHFLGSRTDVERIIKTSDMFVLSSHFEGLALVTIEAMAGGLPVIASNVSGVRDIVSETGLLFERGNAGELADLIQQVTENESLQKEMIRKGREESALYSIEAFVDKFTAFYKKNIGAMRGANNPSRPFGERRADP